MDFNLDILKNPVTAAIVAGIIAIIKLVLEARFTTENGNLPSFTFMAKEAIFVGLLVGVIVHLITMKDVIKLSNEPFE
jgi:hypothetical protein